MVTVGLLRNMRCFLLMTARCAAPAALLVAVAACTTNEPVGGVPVQEAWERPVTPATAPAAARIESSTRPQAGDPAADLAAAGDDDVLALADGEALSRQAFTSALMETHGARVLEQWVLLAAARAKARSLGLTVTRADIQASEDEALARIAEPTGDEPPLDRRTAARLLEEFLEARNISPLEWRLRVEQRAWIRRIAAWEVERFEITEAILREEHESICGERVRIRHIQLSDLAAVERARARLAGGARFEDLAREMSGNPLTAARGGLMPPFARHDAAVPPLLRQAAFALTPGEVPPAVYENGQYHLITLAERIAPCAESFEQADRGRLRGRVVARLIERREETLEVELFRAARVEIRDPGLQRAFRARRGRTSP